MGLKEELEKGVDEILAEVLADYENQDPDLDRSKGSMVFMSSSAQAAAKWGVLQALKWVRRQVFPDTADSAELDHWGWIFGVSRKSGEGDKDYLARVLNRIQEPPAGGNKNDYEQWALEVTNVKSAFCYPMYLGLGTVGVLIIADADATGDEVPSSHTDVAGTNTSVSAGKLVDSAATFVTSGVAPGDKVRNTDTGKEASVVTVDSETQLTLSADIFAYTGRAYTVTSLVEQVRAYIEGVQPLIPEDGLGVFGPTILTQDVDITVTGDSADTALIKSDIEAYMGSLKPDQTLYVSQLISLALLNGAENATVSTPSADVVPAQYQAIRPGTVTVTEA